MAIRRPPTTFSDSITGADLASDIAISTTGNITLSGTNNLGSNPTVTLGSNATFPAGHIINTENAVYDTQTTHTTDDWATVFSVNITPKYNNSKIMVSYYCTMERTSTNGGNLGYGFRIQRTAPSSSGVVGQSQNIGIWLLLWN